MKTIFSELYNRIMEFFQGDKGEQTSQCAANRLQVILMHDRTKLDSATMAKMREELIGVFSKYVIIDNDELEIGLKSEGDSVALMLNIPIIRAKTEEELREALKEEDEHADETVEENAEETVEEKTETTATDETVDKKEESAEPRDDDEEQDETVEEVQQEKEEATEEKQNTENEKEDKNNNKKLK